MGLKLRVTHRVLKSEGIKKQTSTLLVLVFSPDLMTVTEMSFNPADKALMVF